MMRISLSLMFMLTVLYTDAAQRELLKTERFPTTAGKLVVIDAADLDVTVRAADVHELIVTTDLQISGVGEKRAESWINNHTPTFNDSEEKLLVTVQPGKDGFMGLGLLTARARMRVVLPTNVIPDLTTTSGRIKLHGDFPDADPLRLRTATGDMELTGAAGSIDIRTTSGDSTVDVMRPLTSFFARTSAGHVTLTGGALSAHAETASGDIRLSNLSGSVHASSSTGRVSLSWDRLGPSSTIKALTAQSRIMLVIPAGSEPRGTLRTVTGTIRSDFPGHISEQGDSVFLEGGGAVIEAETASGQLTLEAQQELPVDPL
jgi:DUF4097 and DUF4098 domain-containing protein YvlB